MDVRGIYEIDEAIRAGERVLDRIDEVNASLNSARGWGIVDMISKNGFISGMIKHSKLNEANHKVEDLKYEINVFNSELDDVRVFGNVGDLNITGFLKFADFFMDGFIVDFMVLSRINESKRKLQELEDQVNRVLGCLYEMRGV